jgi:hypothetical protein
MLCRFQWRYVAFGRLHGFSDFSLTSSKGVILMKLKFNRNTVAATLGTALVLSTSFARADAPAAIDVSTVVAYITAGLAAVALIGVAKMTIAAAPAAYQALMGFIRR